MNNLKYNRKRRNTITAIVAAIAAICILILMVFASNNQDDNEVQAINEDITHETTIPEGYIAITTKEDLANINNTLGGNYILMNDIDLTGVSFDVIAKTSSSAFTGTFDGNNYTISNLKIESANQYVGLFGYINGGTVKNLTIENADIKSTYVESSSSYGYVGGIAGYVSGRKHYKHRCYRTKQY